MLYNYTKTVITIIMYEISWLDFRSLSNHMNTVNYRLIKVFLGEDIPTNYPGNSGNIPEMIVPSRHSGYFL